MIVPLHLYFWDWTLDVGVDVANSKFLGLDFGVCSLLTTTELFSIYILVDFRAIEIFIDQGFV